MKKIYLFMVALFLATAINNANSQEMIVGGNMEDSTAWIQTGLNGDPGQVVNVEFNYTDDVPIEGDGGCLHVTTQTDDPMVNYMIYQEVTVQRGVEYTCDLAFKNTIDLLNFWFEVYAGGNEPTDSSDYGADQGAVLLGGFKYSGWVEGCSDLIDGSLGVDNCLDSVNTITYDGEGDTTVYVGIKFGMGWAVISADFMVDEISFQGPATPVNELSKSQTKNLVYPNPAANQIRVLNIQGEKLQIIDIVGKEVYTTRNIRNEMEIDISHFSSGIYFVKTGDSISMFIKE